MAKKHVHTDDVLTRIGKKTEGFIVKYLKIILVSVGSAVILAAAFFIVQYFFNKNEVNAESMFSKVYLEYNRINTDSSLGEDQKKEELMLLGEDSANLLPQRIAAFAVIIAASRKCFCLRYSLASR